MLPKQFVQGDILKFSVAPFRDSHGRDITPPSWKLSLHIRGNGNTLSANAVDFEFNIGSVDTQTCKAGRAYFQVLAVNEVTNERSVVQQGSVEIIASFADTDNTFDPRSQTQKDLEAVQNLIRQLIKDKGGVVEYKIGTRSLKRYDLAELRALESQLKGQLVLEQKAQKIADGLGNPTALYVRFKPS